MQGEPGMVVPRAVVRALPGVAVLALGFVIGLGVIVHGTRSPLRVDRFVDGHLLTDEGWRYRAADHLVQVGDPVIFTIVMIVLVAIGATFIGLRAALGFGLAVGAVALIVEYAAKPLFDRHMSAGTAYSYPSGHATVSFAAATIVVLLCLPSSALHRSAGRVLRGLLALSAVAIAVAISLSMVMLGAHYFTDVLGSVPLGVVLAAAIAAATDRWLPISRRPLLLLLRSRASRPEGQQRPRSRPLRGLEPPGAHEPTRGSSPPRRPASTAARHFP